MGEKRRLLFSTVTACIFIDAKIKQLLQNKVNGLDCSTMFVLICHVLADVIYRDSIERELLVGQAGDLSC